jgi:hypothetical protein
MQPAAVLVLLPASLPLLENRLGCERHCQGLHQHVGMAVHLLYSGVVVAIVVSCDGCP